MIKEERKSCIALRELKCFVSPGYTQEGTVLMCLRCYLGGYFPWELGETAGSTRIAYASHTQFIFRQYPLFHLFFFFCAFFSFQHLLFYWFACATFYIEEFSDLWPCWWPIPAPESQTMAIASGTNVDARLSAEPHSRVLCMRP